MLGALTLTACNDSDDKKDYNSNPGITVSFASAELSYKENHGMVSVPMVLSGETNGYVTVEVAVKEYGSSVAMEDVHYLLTSKTYTFDTGATTGALEMKLVDDAEVNDPREFEITIKSAQGASIGEPSTTIVTIKDNDADPYEKLGGIWYMPCIDSNGSPATREVLFVPYDDGEPGFQSYLQIQNLLYPFSGSTPVNIKADFNYDENTGKGTLSIPYGQELPDVDLSAYGYGQGTGFLGYFVGSNSFDITGSAIFEIDADNIEELPLISDPSGDEEANFVYFVEVSAGYLYTDAVESVTKLTRTK